MTPSVRSTGLRRHPKGWYVDNSLGTNGNGASWATAWNALANIVWASISPGDTVFISGGTSGQTYNETLTIGASGSSGRNIVISAGEDPGHNGTVIIDAQVTRDRCVDIGARNWVTVQNLTVQNNNGYANIVVNGSTAGAIIQNIISHTGVGAGSGSDTRAFDIRNCVVSGAPWACILRGCSADTPSSTTSQTDNLWTSGNNGVLIEGNSFVCQNTDNTGHSDNWQSDQDINVTFCGNFCSHPNGGSNNHGFYLNDIAAGGTLTIYNNVIYMPTADTYSIYYGMITSGWTGTPLIYNNTIYGGYACIYLDPCPSTTMLKNNLIYVLSGIGIQQASTALPAANIDHNLIFGPTTGAANNLTVSSTSSASTGAVRSTTSKSSGLVYFEVTIGGAWAGANSAVGIANSSQSLTTWLGNSANGAGFFSSGRLYVNGGWNGPYAAYSPGDTLAFALDASNKKLWIKNLTAGSGWNNDVIANQNPAGDVGGFAFTITGPYFAAASIGAAGDSATFNFGASSFAGTLPSGYSAWGSATTLNPSDIGAPATLSPTPAYTVGVSGGTNYNWSGWQGLGYDIDGVNADPLFTNVSGQDFTLQTGSPAIDAGVSLSAVVLDKNGVLRSSRGSAPDIGAFEH